MFKKRIDAINQARAKYVSFLDVLRSPGWKVYEEEIQKRVDATVHKFENALDLTPEDLKRLQLALQVYKEVQRIPKTLEERGKK